MSRDAPPIAELDVFGCPLDGVRLIEASAGTGKTWNICGLVLRLLLERGLTVQQVLVVTFTNAATAELRERVRARLVETLAHLRGAVPAAGADPFVATLVETLRTRAGLGDETIRSRLELALAGFDEASIFTIHGFCQRALADTPFSAQMPMTTELLADDGELLHEAVHDFWRRRIATDTLDPALAACLVERKDTPAKYARLLRRHLAKPTARAVWPDGIDGAGGVDAAALQAAHEAACAMWRDRRDEIIECVSAGLGTALSAVSYKANTVDGATEAWDQLAQQDNALVALSLVHEKLDLLGATRLRKATKQKQATPEHPFFAAAQALLDLRAQAGDTLVLARARLLRELLDEASTALRVAKRQRRVVSFDDMLYNLHERLTDGTAPWLAGALRRRFPAALIDEFQDTDPLQFAIFRTVYGAGEETSAAPLFLVGDPKQAIYSFRNADLHTYLQARDLAGRHAGAISTLLHNQRSTEPLLNALNALFTANPQAFMLQGLDYHCVAYGDKRRDVLEDRSGSDRAALQVWMLPDDADDGAPLKLEAARSAALAACAAEVARLLAAAQRGEVKLGGRDLHAGDIAVLVRSRADGSAARRALAALGIASVELAHASVFRSPDAQELERLLHAVLEPANARGLKTALATEAMGQDAAAIDALGTAGEGGEDGAALSGAMQRFAAYRDIWLARGVGFMLRRWLHDEQVVERLLARPDGERRMTNWLHLIELAHEASAQHPSPDALLRWLQAQRRDDRQDDATQLRLESDRRLVQIVTVHKSKGLEYPIVFCPLLWTQRGGGSRGSNGEGVEYHAANGQAVIDYRDAAAKNADIKSRVRREDAAETMRLLYVALTRAVHRCVLVAGCFRSGASESVKASTRSLLHWLAAGDGHTPDEWLDGERTPESLAAAWQALAARAARSAQMPAPAQHAASTKAQPEPSAPALSIVPLPTAQGVPLPAQRPAPEQLDALRLPRPLPAPWRIGSYSALVHGIAHEQAAADHDLHAAPPPPAGMVAQATQPPDATEPAGAASSGAGAPRPDDMLRFPRGAQAGVVVHAVFERIDFTDPSGWPGVIDEALRGLPAAAGAGQAGGAAAHAAAAPAAMLRRMLDDVTATPLPLGTATPLVLATLPPQRRLNELEFHLRAPRLDARTLNGWLARHGHAVPALSFAALRGILKGYIDLVCEHDGRWFVVDWKSNHLGGRPEHYARGALDVAMAAQGYQLQALLYAVALDRLLRLRLPGYDPALHFGGTAYLFVRGLRPGWTAPDGAPHGLHFHRPAPEVLRSLSALLDGAPDEAAEATEAAEARA